MKRFLRFALVLVLFAGLLMSSSANAQLAHGSLYVTGGSTSQALSTTAAKLTGFTTAGENSGGDTSIVPAAASDNIALLAGATYLIHFDATVSSDTADIVITFSLRNGATAITGAQCQMIAEVAAAPTNASLTWLYKPAAAATLNVYAASASGTPALTPIEMQLVVVRLK